MQPEDKYQTSAKTADEPTKNPTLWVKDNMKDYPWGCQARNATRCLFQDSYYRGAL